MWWFGAVKYVYQSALPAGCCYLLNSVTMSAWSTASVNRCLPPKRACPCRGRKAGGMAVTALALLPEPAAHREQLKQGSSKGGCGSSEYVVGGTLAKVDQVPLGFGVPAQLLCTFKYLLYNSTLCGSAKTTQQLCSTDKNRIQVFRLRPGRAFHLMSVRPVLGHVHWWKDHGQMDSNKSQPLLHGLKC